jgi:spermidine synthase
MPAAEVRSAVDASLGRRRWAPDAAASAGKRAASEVSAAAWPILALVFVSGLTALVYEVLWLKELALLLGSTSRSAAITLVAFFLGLALGNHAFGRRAAASRRPLRVYAALELGVALAALAYFALFDVYVAAYAQLFQSLRQWPGGLVALKLALATGLVLPAAFLMGGTLPVVCEHLARRESGSGGTEIGRTGSLVYSVNTFGGAIGAFLAGFWLPPLLGYDASYLTAIAVNLAIAATAFALGGAATDAGALREHVREETAAGPRAAASRKRVRTPRETSDPFSTRLPASAFLALVAASGFAALGLEVLWTRMFAQVLHNSVYSFAAILVTFLTTLGAGAGLARILMTRSRDRAATLGWLLVGAGLAIGATPFVFHLATNGLRYVAANEGWLAYVGTVFGLAALVIGIPGVLLGSVFPFLLGLAPAAEGVGRSVGRLAAINTLGSIAGSLAAGFVLLEWLGLWGSIRTLALIYPIAALALAARTPAARPIARAATSRRTLGVAALVALGALVTFLDPARLPRLPDLYDPKHPLAIHRVWEGSDGTVAVVSVDGHLRTIVDNYYSLGSSDDKQYEETQADLPLLLHPRPRSVFFLGLGTGITAGAALRHPVDRVVAAELSPEVVAASREYFDAHTNGLFEDPRAEVVVDDGRQYLLATGERFDVVVGDLFIPWQAGAGNLYSAEHFRAVRDRLAPGGLFAQWLPLYQLSKDEFLTITRTMLDVFPQVTLWRGDFLAERPIVALVGQNEVAPLDPDALVDNYRHLRGSQAIGRESVLALMGMFYAANPGAVRERFEDHAANTDDRPLIEYGSPVTHREQRAGRAGWLVGSELVDWYADLNARSPLADDPYLARLEPREVGFVEAGLALLRAQAAAAQGDQPGALGHFEEFRRRVPPAIAARFEKAASQRMNRDGRTSS